MLLALLSLVAAACATASPVLYHGTSAVVPVNKTSSLNSNTTRAASFYCYMTEKGYFSFGWWVPPSSIGNSSHCQPDSDSFHWVELAQRRSCNEETGSCLYRTQHVPVREPDDGELPLLGRSLQYVIQPLTSKKRDDEEINLSYIDTDGVQFNGVGTRRKLSGEPLTVGECRKALRTLKQTYDRLDIDLDLEIGDPCAQDADIDHGWVSEL
ncbi:hypothetical protein F5Y13DRAFT_184127 [Hypoxylon sp. FL1857]|nr:hypothetical protein F5Y13DRAFT_184127 [Hypoxylon sp. FL1857]